MRETTAASLNISHTICVPSITTPCLILCSAAYVASLIVVRQSWPLSLFSSILILQNKFTIEDEALLNPAPFFETVA